MVDTLRADHLGFAGAEDATTPALDALAARGRVFLRATSAVPVTLPSISTILSGRWPSTHGVRDNAGFVLADSVTTLAEVLHRTGFRTAAILASAVLRADRGLGRGFDLYDDRFEEDTFAVHDPALAPLAAELGHSQRRATAVTDRALRWWRQQRGHPRFLLVHYFDPHAPYDPPPAFARRHPQRPYDGEIAYVDAEIGRLVEAVGPRTLVVVVADHGEGLGEHGEPEHGFFLYESTLHVPFLIAGPGVVPATVEEEVSLVDVAPTLLARAGSPGSLDRADGIALPLDTDPPADRLLRAETLRPLISYGWQELRALRRGRHKLIAGRDSIEAYDLTLDPAETTPLALDPAFEELVRAWERWSASEDVETIRREAVARARGEDQRRRELASLGYTSATDRPAPRNRPHPGRALPSWVERQRNRVRAREALLALREGRPAQSLALLDRALADQPGRADLLTQRSQVLETLGRTEAAARDLDAALQADSLFVPALRRRAERRIREGDLDGAITDLRRSVQAAPTDADARYNLGVALLRRGHRDEAIASLRAFLEIAPSDPRAPAVRAQLAGMAGSGEPLSPERE